MEKTHNELLELDQSVHEGIKVISTSLVQAAVVIANEKICAYSEKRKERDEVIVNEIVEEDGVQVGGIHDSVGTTIKKEAVRLHSDYYNLSLEQKDSVALGLNSVLDLTQEKYAIQKKLFGEESWRSLINNTPKNLFNNNSVVKKYKEEIAKIEKMAKDDIRDARAYAYKLEMKSTRPDEADLFALYSQYLEILEYHDYIFEKHIDITEADVTIKMWGPLLEKVFRQTKLRCKWGESVGDSSGTSNGMGYKVDLRILKDTMSRKNKEADKANVEIARMNASVAKITKDKTKLLLESKCILDRLVKEAPHSVTEIIIPALQLIGNKSQLISLKLMANGLYVGIKEGAAVIPSKVARIKDFQHVVNLLFMLKRAVLDVSDITLKESEDSLNTNKLLWLRGSWSPPSDAKKKPIPPLPNPLIHADICYNT
ncbi:hypothetical protein BDF14DRAFT_1807795 [Spinellus fusiger]|nr:hypothetical protein BDF14DRAFT_1807795 [Spinellus fusiger]